jgi:rhamnogalacturonan endolyase
MQKLLLIGALLITGAARTQTVSLQQTGDIVTLSNDHVSFSFNKTNGDITEIKTLRSVSGKADHQQISLLGSKGRGYLLGPGFSMSPSQFSIVRQGSELAEISFYHSAPNHFQYDLHYVLRKDDHGIYCFLVQSHKAGDSTGIYGQTRWGIRADEHLFDYHLVRDSIQGPMPKMAELKDDVQDWTYRLDDSSYYTKYDYADYIEGRHVHGMAGQTSGLGLFVIQASHEYLNGGPTKQYQNVHATPYLICMFNCGHFLSDIRKGDDHISGDWSKLDGPFFLYVNEGKDIPAIWMDAKRQAAEEVAHWPYAWMQHSAYPLQRGKVTGQLLISGQPAAPGTHIILAAPGYDWQAQSQGYIFSTQTAEEGKFTLDHVRSGAYTLYACGSNQMEEFRRANVTVDENKVTTLGSIDWQPVTYGETLWQLGVADRTTRGFRLSDHKRNYGLFDSIPPDLTFTIGVSKEKTDWYYAQTKPGSWNINFTLSKTYEGDAALRLALAGAAKKPFLEIYLNDQKIGSYDKLGNDASIYRSAVLGGYYQQLTLRFPAALLKKGSNTLSLKLPNVKSGGGIMYDAIRLEAPGTILSKDDFTAPLDTTLWHVEMTPRPGSKVCVQNGKLLLDTWDGVTVWLKRPLTGNIMIEYKRKVLMEGGANDRLSDLNQFWMASDPQNRHFFSSGRAGMLQEYDSLNLYYVGMGGNSNSTTRFRKYQGNGERALLQEYKDTTHLLLPNKEYRITIIVKDGMTTYAVDDVPYFIYKDPNPLKEGYFGFRSTRSRQEIQDFRIYRID